jgi:hypothetical protein
MRNTLVIAFASFKIQVRTGWNLSTGTPTRFKILTSNTYRKPYDVIFAATFIAVRIAPVTAFRRIWSQILTKALEFPRTGVGGLIYSY